MKSIATSLIGAAALLALLAGCGDQEVLLEGERLEIRPEEAVAAAVTDRAIALNLPASAVNADWTQQGGNPQHRIAHPALGQTLAALWAAPIGQGNDRKHRITADPVVADGRIYTLDSRALVSAHTLSGAALWTRDLTPPSDRSDDASGGGIAASTGAIYVTSGFGTLTALDAATGDVLWEQVLDAVATGAPTVSGGTVYAVSRNAVGWALDAATGRILWQVFGAPSASGIAGGPAPAIAGSLVIFPFSSGQMAAAVAGPGTQVWTASVGGQRTGRAFSRVSDLSGDPVVVDNVVYAGNHSGRAAAFDATTGSRLWLAEEGAMSQVSVAGGSVFLVSDENRLVRLDAASGATIWARDLPFFTRDRLAKRKSTYAHYGPLLAGGRLIVASDDAMLRQFDPSTGDLITATPLPAGAARNPVVAGGTLYLVTEDGELRAFR